MTQQKSYPSSAREAYDAFAPVYDRFNQQNDYEVWLGGVLLPELEKHGLKVGRVLDVGCGTGQAFAPLLARGWQVSGCDLSEGMLLRVREKFSETTVGLWQADAADLPAWPKPFDLILLLNDVVNYLTEDGDLERCFAGVARNLAPGGLVCFDANSLGLMRSNFAGEGMTRGEWTWRGSVAEVEPEGTYEATVSGPGIEDHVHCERHWTEDQIQKALNASDLRCLARLGQREEDGQIILSEGADEERDAKVVYICG